MSMRPVDLSIVVAAHAEGLIAHKTIRSIERATSYLDQAGIRYEIIATLDRPDTATRNYFSGEFAKAVRFFEVDFGDLAASRNFGVEKARGVYVALVDADDLVSEQWFLRAYKLAARSSKDIVVHTEYSVNFVTQSIVWHKYNSLSKEQEALINVQANRWDSAIVIRKSLLKKFPYEANLKGFGSEDWHFNSQTLAANIPHVVAPETALFVRRKSTSEMTIQKTDRRTIHYTDLLDFDFFHSFDAPILLGQLQAQIPTPVNSIQVRRVKSLLKRSLGLAYKQSSHMPILGKKVVRLKNKLLSNRSVTTSPSKTLDLPQWLYDEWAAIQSLEQQLFPSRELLQHTSWYYAEMYELGIFYWRLVQHVSKRPEYIIFVPYLNRGGADLFAVNYANTLAQQGVSVLMIATQDSPSEWQTRLDNRVDFLPFGRLAGNLDKDLQLQVLMRFVIQSRAKTLHILQSALAYDFVEVYGNTLSKNNYKIFCSAYCDDVDQEGHIAGYIHTGLPRVYEHITKVFTDNSFVIEQLHREYAFDKKRFVIHHQPIEAPIPERKNVSAANGRKFLWAGRIAKQKRPDILKEIAQKLKHTAITIDVYGSFQDGFDQSFFDNSPALRYKGPFNGLFSLPYGEYAALLYTSERDGLPNILLEAAAVGLPAIAPNIGGIPDFVTQDIGIIIADNADVDAYVKAIQHLYSNPGTACSLGEQARRAVEEQHSQKIFQNEITRDIKNEVKPK